MKTNQPFRFQWLLMPILIGYSLSSISQSKISLKKYNDPSYSGYKNIVFEYEEEVPGQRGEKRKVTKEFDVEANNPLISKLGSPNSRDRKGMHYSNKPPINSYLSEHNLAMKMEEVEEAHQLIVRSAVHESEKHVVVTYRASIIYGHDVVTNTSVSHFKVFDQTGSVFLDKKVNHLLGDLKVSANSNFVVYNFDNYGAHSLLQEEPGFVVWNVETNKEVISKSAIVNIIYSADQIITVSVYENKIKYLYLVDTRDGSIYRTELPTNSSPGVKVVNNDSLKIGNQVFFIPNLLRIL